MKKFILVILLIQLQIYGQQIKNIADIVGSYPEYTNINNLANRIDTDFNSKFLKTKATYFWLAKNIKYYKEITNTISPPQTITYFNEKDLKRQQKIINNKLVNKTLNTKKSICKGYAYTFKAICDLLHIKNEVIKGYAKNTPDKIGRFPKYKNHIWNAIKIKGKWLLVDATYGSGEEVDMFYFDIDKEKLNLTHYPEKQKWIQLMYQKPLLNFSLEPIYYNAFIKSDIEILNPNDGIIKPVVKAKNIIFKFKDILNTDIKYSYGLSNIGLSPYIYLNDDNSITVSIKKPKKDNFLNIYFNNKLALQYNVSIK